MEMKEYVNQVSFLLGLDSTELVEDTQIEKAINIAFRELKRYLREPVSITVPFQIRIDLKKLGIKTKKIINVRAAQPRIGLTMSSIDSGNVFQVAAAVNTYSAIGNTSSINIDPIMTEMAMAQVRNTLSTDFQWSFDKMNEILYVTHRDPKPSQVTIKYVPTYEDVSEIIGDSYIDYLVRMSTANMKIALGRIRSKYRVEGSNVSLDGEVLLNEGNEELAKIREELDQKKNRWVVVN